MKSRERATAHRRRQRASNCWRAMFLAAKNKALRDGTVVQAAAE
jgi:hypothetical protein